MERVYTIGADTHCAFTELAAISPGGRLVHRDRCCTTIPALAQAVAEVGRPRVVVIEEGPPADWLSRGLSDRGKRASPTGTPPAPAETTTASPRVGTVRRHRKRRPSESNENRARRREGLLTSCFI